jgi:glucosamine-6-phosphate deaminase
MGLDFSGVTVFGLDEYLDLAPDHPASCHRTLREHLIEPVDIAPSRIHLLEGTHRDDLDAYCAAFERSIQAAGGLDLQILGLGVNGHVGFNEPGCSLGGPTHVIGLRASTRATNAPIFPPPEEVPHAALSMGIGTILAARRVLLLVTGSAKAAALAKAIEGPVTAMVPASALQLHPDTVVIADEAAAAGLSLRPDFVAEITAVARRPGLAAAFGLED